MPTRGVAEQDPAQSMIVCKHGSSTPDTDRQVHFGFGPKEKCR